MVKVNKKKLPKIGGKDIHSIEKEIPSNKESSHIKKNKDKIKNEKKIMKNVKYLVDTNDLHNVYFNKNSSKEILPKLGDEFDVLQTKYRSRPYPHVTGSSDWISQLILENEENTPIPLSVRRQLKDFAASVYQDDMTAYKQIQERKNARDNQYFHKAVLTHGTTKDRVSALAFICMENPVYSLNELFSLIDYIDHKLKSNIHATKETVVNLFRTTYLANGHRAKEFECHNFSLLLPLVKSNAEQVEKQLLLWYFENQVRLAYLKFIDNLEKLCHDTQLLTRKQGMKGLELLLKSHPNQDEEVILQKLINKLGDINKKVAGEVVQSLNQIQVSCPQLKSKMVSLVEEILYRPNISNKAQYYGLCFLKDVIFRKVDVDIAKKLIKIYFDFFQICSKKGEVDSNFMSALLRGVNRAYPFLEEKYLPFVEEQLATLHELVHLVNFRVASQVMQFLYQMQSSSTRTTSSDRFYTLLYGKLLDPAFGTSSSCGAFLNIVFKSMVKDNSVPRISAFIRRLLQVSLGQPSKLACAVLFLISEAIKDNPSLKGVRDILLEKTVIYARALSLPDLSDDSEDDYEYYPDLDDDNEEHSNKKSHESLSSSQETDSSSNNPSTCDSSETKFDVKKVKVKTESSWFHRQNLGNVSKGFKGIGVRTNHYDLTIRNPLFSGADLDPIWELRIMEKHFHPSVSVFASDLLKGKNVTYSGDPLEDFTLTRFLDRFAHRNPKKLDPSKNVAAIILGNRSYYKPRGSRSFLVESENFKKLQEEKVAAEDMFLHSYYTKYKKQKEDKEEPKRKRRNRDDDESSIDDDEFDDHLRKMSGFEDLGDDDEDEELDSMNFARNAKPLEDDKDISDDGSINDSDEMDDYEDDFDDEQNSDEQDDSFEDDLESDYSEEDDFLDEISPAKKPKSSKNLKGRNWDSDLVDAEEFTRMLEQNADADDEYAGTSEAVRIKGKTHKKQLLWEKKNNETGKMKNKGFGKPNKNNNKFKAKNKLKMGKRK